MKNKFIFYLLSFTWGLPMTLLGCIVSLILMIFGKRPKRYGVCWYFEIGSNWGGMELGPVFLIQKNAQGYLKRHEAGHALQNMEYGIFMPFLVCIPSATRYWYRKFRKWIGHPCSTGYYDIWFEAEASEHGETFRVLYL